MTDHKYLTATSRAARMVAGQVSNEAVADYLRPLIEARTEGRVEELVLALVARCGDLAREAYGDQAQQEVDSFAFAALKYENERTNGGRQP